MQTTKLAAAEIAALDPYKFMATIGKRVIHPGGRASTDALLHRAGIHNTDRVLDVGCGVGTTAIGIARRHGATVTAVDIEPLMIQRAQANVTAAGIGHRVTVESVTMFVDRARAAAELTRVTRPGGKVLATEFCWREPPTDTARGVFIGQVCPGLQFDTLDDWIQLYRAAGLSDISTESGPFEMMTPRGILADEGAARSLAIMGRVVSRPANFRKMRWLMPRLAKAVPYLGYILLEGTKPQRDDAGDTVE